MRIKRIFAMLLVVMLCVTAFSTVAYAGGGEEGDEPVIDLPVEETLEPTIQPGEPFSEDGNLITRDLLYDEHTNKQFITVETRGGNTFYIVIDYDKPTDEDGEQYHTYFLNMVDEADLLALLEDESGEAPSCSCAQKCVAGNVNVNCPVCATNMTECTGKEAQPAQPETSEPDPEPEAEEKSSILPILLILVLFAGGGAAVYLKLFKNKGKTKASPDLDDYDFGDEDDAPDEPDEVERDDASDEGAAPESEDDIE